MIVPRKGICYSTEVLVILYWRNLCLHKSDWDFQYRWYNLPAKLDWNLTKVADPDVLCYYKPMPLNKAASAVMTVLLSTPYAISILDKLVRIGRPALIAIRILLKYTDPKLLQEQAQQIIARNSTEVNPYGTN